MSLSTQPVKGARDFYPEEMRIQKYIFAKWREVCERYGYEEYDAPILEPTELYLSKGNEEIVREQTYSFTDRGGREVTLRTEMTPTVSRMVAAKRQELAYPLRLFSIPQCWRYERMQRGRGREFYQLNVDVFGINGIEADFEVFQLADALMQTYGARRDMYTIRLNSRKLMNYYMSEILKLDETQSTTLARLIDRRAKIDSAEFAGQVDVIFSPIQREASTSNQLFAFLDVKSLDDLPGEFKAHESVSELRQLMQLLEEAMITNVVFDPTLMRGFEYYTGTAFEVFDTAPENNRSMFGGGRYEDLVGAFGVEPISAVGFAMGDITMLNFLETHDLMPDLRSESDIYVITIGDHYQQVQPLVARLRDMDLNVVVDSSVRKIEKKIKVAEKKGIPYVLFIGEAELDSEQFTLKNLSSGEEEKHALERIASIVRDYRSQ